jgi:hypothetical protein
MLMLGYCGQLPEMNNSAMAKTEIGTLAHAVAVGSMT